EPVVSTGRAGPPCGTTPAPRRSRLRRGDRGAPRRHPGGGAVPSRRRSRAAPDPDERRARRAAAPRSLAPAGARRCRPRRLLLRLRGDRRGAAPPRRRGALPACGPARLPLRHPRGRGRPQDL
ncbi:MAG: hypothetical protein AVDCRST_MAG88-234, partial [uncultured Thermomicrobiales bacterium]